MPRKVLKKKDKELENKKKAVAHEDLFFEEIDHEIEDAKTSCGVWRAAQDKWHRMRMCIKKTKTFPFTGCANIRLPVIETKLRKVKSNLVKVILGVRPIVSAIPSPSGTLETAQKIEKWLDHLIMDIMQFKPKAIIGIDQSIEKGFYLLKPFWRTEIVTRIEKYSTDDLDTQEVMWLYDPIRTSEELKQAMVQYLEVDMNDLVAEENDKALDDVISQIKEGKTELKCEIKDVLYNYPDVALANPEFVYVPNDSHYNPQDCRMITHDFFLPYDTVKKNVELKGWSKSAVDTIDWLRTQPLDNVTEGTKDTREGVSRLQNPSQLVRIYETYMYYDLNDDGDEEKCVFTFAPEFGVTLRKITLPLNNGKFPFVKLCNEITDDRWFSHRGMCELIADLVREIDTQHNQKLDSQTWRNAPMITYRAGVVNPNLIKLMPNQAIPRHDVDDIAMLQNTNLNADFSYEKEQMILETKIEELIGQVDYSLQSMIHKRQPRTAFEVGQQSSSAQMVFSLDADVYTEAFSELFSFIWDLWCQYGNDEEEFSYFGENGWEKIKLSREEIQGKYKIVVRGNDQNFNPEQRMQKASQVLQSMMAIPPQLGIVSPENLYNGLKYFYQTMDVKNWEQFITDPKTLPPQPPPPADVKIGMEDLTTQEQAQVKSQQNIQPDMQGMLMKEKQDQKNETMPYNVDMMKTMMNQSHDEDITALELQHEREMEMKRNAKKPEKQSAKRD